MQCSTKSALNQLSAGQNSGENMLNAILLMTNACHLLLKGKSVLIFFALKHTKALGRFAGD